MRIAFDIDDTITRCPEFFAVISKALRAAGHKVYIISYREDRGFAEEDLAECGVSYDELILFADDERKAGGAKSWQDEAGRWKAEVCRQLEIDVLFDDMPEVVSALDEQTAAFMTVDPSLGSVAYERP
ncbi:MAG: hypothetical protein KA354_12275 [Phycisphaerae bacterium]|nr:hypothetical protein [Phycisphaerae bacterium]